MRNTDKLFIMWKKEDDTLFREFFKVICGKEIEHALLNLEGTHYLAGVIGLRDIHEKTLRLSAFPLILSINKFPEGWAMKYEHRLADTVKRFKDLPKEARKSLIYSVKRFSLFPLKRAGFYQFIDKEWTRLT